MNYYWIGARESDIRTEKVFKGSITKYGTNSNSNISFAYSRKNYSEKDYLDFVKEQLTNILNNDCDGKFIFSNAELAYKMPLEILNHCECLNSFSIITALNDKFFVRQYLSDVCKIPQNIIANGKLLKDINFVRRIFNKQYDQFVVQKAIGGGGKTSFFLNKNDMTQIPNNEDFLITPYFKNSIPINVHCIIYNNDILILPPSMQLIINNFKFIGSDFCAINNLDYNIKSEIYNYSYKISEKLQKIGVRGIFGLDFIIVNNEILLLESNLRFQGSTFLLNFGLNKLGISIYELFINSFKNNESNIDKAIFNTKINLSFYKLMNHIDLQIPLTPIAENYDGYCEISNMSDNAYKYNRIFSESIACFLRGN